MPRSPARFTQADVAPVFVSADMAARLCGVSVDTWRAWVQSGYAPRPAIERGQIIRWHWPTVESRLASAADEALESDPFMQGVADAQKKVRSRVIA